MMNNEALALLTAEAEARGQHLHMVEVEDKGGRYWSGPYMARAVTGVMADYERYGMEISDVDHATACWCNKKDK